MCLLLRWSCREFYWRILVRFRMQGSNQISWSRYWRHDSTNKPSGGKVEWRIVNVFSFLCIDYYFSFLEHWIQVLDENDEFRDRLGIDARDMTDIAKLRKSRALRQQQYRAENQILLKEIERLEEERIELKQLVCTDYGIVKLYSHK